MDWFRNLLGYHSPSSSQYDYFIQASGNLADAEAVLDATIVDLEQLTRFATIRDPLRHIIRGMIGPQPIMQASIYTVYELAGRFYFEVSDDAAMLLKGTKAKVRDDYVVEPDGTQCAVRYRMGACRLDDDRWCESYMRTPVLLHRK